jgi:hypothetical protein
MTGRVHIEGCVVTQAAPSRASLGPTVLQIRRRTLVGARLARDEASTACDNRQPLPQVACAYS